MFPKTLALHEVSYDHSKQSLFTTQLQNINRPAAAEKPAAAHSASTTAASAATAAEGEKASAQQSNVLPVGLVGNHINTTA
jgi:hypothetical protein